MEERIEGFMATVCAFKQMADPDYKEFVTRSLKDFIDNKRKRKTYTAENVLLVEPKSEQKFSVTIMTDKDGKFVVYDKDDKKPVGGVS